MSTKNPFFVSPPSDFQQFGSGKFQIDYAGTGIKFSINGGNTWQVLPDYISWVKGSTTFSRDTTPNETARTISIPSDEIWEVLSIYLRISTTANVGNRNWAIMIRNENDDYFYQSRTGNIPASTTDMSFSMGSVSNETSFTDTIQYKPLPLNFLPPSYSIYITELNSVDSNDDIQTVIYYRNLESLNYKTLSVECSDLLISWTDSITQGTEQKVHVLKLD